MSEIKKKRNRYKNTDIKDYLARFPKSLHLELTELSKEKGIALNKIIIIALNEYLEKERQ